MTGMSIDKESNGVPEVNLHRRTTKVNLAIIIAVVVFLIIGIGTIAWLANR